MQNPQDQFYQQQAMQPQQQFVQQPQQQFVQQPQQQQFVQQPQQQFVQQPQQQQFVQQPQQQVVQPQVVVQQPQQQQQQAQTLQVNSDAWVAENYPCLKVPLLNAILSFIFPGLGNGLCGQPEKGIIMFVTLILVHVALNVLAFIPLLGWVSLPIVHFVWNITYRIAAAHDAFVIADRLVKGHRIMKGTKK